MSHSSKFTLPLIIALTGCGGGGEQGIGEEQIGADEKAIEIEMIAAMKDITLRRQADDPDQLMRRFNQVKTLGCVTGEMRVTAPASHAKGLFARAATYPVTLRFANATQLSDLEDDFRGLSLRVHDVGEATGAGGVAGVQDFTLNNHPALIAGTPEDFLEFIRATDSGTVAMLWFLATHWSSIPVVFTGRQMHTSPFAVDYFSTTPYAFGEGAAMKYSVKSCRSPDTRIAQDHDHFLTDALQHDLSSTSHCLNFQVQLQTDPEVMPIEDASVVWPVTASPYVTVAEISLPTQDVKGSESQSSCEQMVFNPWNALPDHRPLGGINRVRHAIYQELGDFRNQHNHFSE